MLWVVASVNINLEIADSVRIGSQCVWKISFFRFIINYSPTEKYAGSKFGVLSITKVTIYDTIYIMSVGDIYMPYKEYRRQNVQRAGMKHSVPVSLGWVSVQALLQMCNGAMQFRDSTVKLFIIITTDTKYRTNKRIQHISITPLQLTQRRWRLCKWPRHHETPVFWYNMYFLWSFVFLASHIPGPVFFLLLRVSSLCSANHRPGYWSNLPCDWPSTAWAYSEQETENGPCLPCNAVTWASQWLK